MIGLVRKPGEYHLPPNQNMQVLDALALAGERTLQIADKVLVIRRVARSSGAGGHRGQRPRGQAERGGELRLAPGDIVSVEETPATLLVRTFTDIVRFTVGGAVSVFY